MTDFFHEAVAWYNLPLTVLLCLVVLYWIVAAFGLVGDGLDADVEADLDADLDLDTGAHTDLDSHAQADVDADADHSGEGLGGLMAVTRFVNMDSVPVMIVVTILVSAVWVLSMMLNHSFNPAGAPLIAALIFAGSFILGTLITKIVTMPLAKFFKKLRALDAEARIPIVGRCGTVKSGEVTTSFGQVEIEKKGAPLIINVRVREGNARLKRGDQCLVVDEIEDQGIYYIRPLKH